MARMIAVDREYVKSKYRLEKLKDIEDLVSQAVEVNIPYVFYPGFLVILHFADSAERSFQPRPIGSFGLS